MKDIIHIEVKNFLNSVMEKVSEICEHPPDCHLCKADLALHVAAILAAGEEKVIANWTKDHYNMLNKIAEEETELHKIEADEEHEKAMQLIFKMQEKEKIKLEIIDGKTD
ncbi:MAG: hypothetical protein ACFFD2_21620 [Promethearchaeota archaeon]